MKNRVQGLTLLELITSIAVLAILASLAVPGFSAVLDRTRASAVSHSLTASLMAARLQAISERLPVAVCPSSDGRHCRITTDWSNGWIVFRDPQRAGQPARERDVLHRGDPVAKTVRLTSSSGRHLIRYQPAGHAAGTNATFRLCSTARGSVLTRVIVSNAGRARVERPRRSLPCTPPG